MTVTLKYRSMLDLVVLAPCLVGFHPNDSVVLMAMRGQVVKLTARLDLIPGVSRRDIRNLKRTIAEQVPVDRFFVVAYTEDEQLARESRICASPGHWAQVWDGGYRTDFNTPFTPIVAEASTAAALATFQGLRVYESRESLRAFVVGLPEAEAGRWRHLAEAIRRSDNDSLGEQQVVQVLCDYAEREVLPDETQVCRLVQHLDVPRLRDLIWSTFLKHNAQRQQVFWSHVVSCTPAEALLRPLVFLGVSAWLQGDGAMLNVCLERAREVSPELAESSVLAMISANLVPPNTWDEALATGNGPGCLWPCCVEKQVNCA